MRYKSLYIIGAFVVLAFAAWSQIPGYFYPEKASKDFQAPVKFTNATAPEISGKTGPYYATGTVAAGAATTTVTATGMTTAAYPQASIITNGAGQSIRTIEPKTNAAFITLSGNAVTTSTIRLSWSK